jgi:hypothetical protein
MGSKLLLPYSHGVAEGEAGAFPSRRSRFISCLSSRFCSFFSCLVNFSAGVVDGAEVVLGEDVDTLDEGEAEGIGSTFFGWYRCA